MSNLCIPKSVLSSASCIENPAGLSNHLWAVHIDDVKVTVSDDKNQYEIEAAAGASAAIQGIRIDFKSQTGQYTSEDNGTGKGWTGTGTGRVELSEDDMAWTSRVLHNSDKYLYFMPTGKKVTVNDVQVPEYVVIGNDNGEAEWAVAADTGAARNDDHGQTFTITCAYQLYPITKFYGTIQEKAVDDSSN